MVALMCELQEDYKLNFPDIISKINNKEDFIKFVELLEKDYEDNYDTWENETIGKYLEGMSIWVDSMDGYYGNMGLEVPKNIPWKIFADILIASKMQE